MIPKIFLINASDEIIRIIIFIIMTFIKAV